MLITSCYCILSNWRSLKVNCVFPSRGQEWNYNLNRRALELVNWTKTIDLESRSAMDGDNSTLEASSGFSIRVFAYSRIIFFCLFFHLPLNMSVVLSNSASLLISPCFRGKCILNVIHCFCCLFMVEELNFVLRPPAPMHSNVHVNYLHANCHYLRAVGSRGWCYIKKNLYKWQAYSLVPKRLVSNWQLTWLQHHHYHH